MAIDPFFGSVLGAASNLIGGAIGHGSAQSANRASEAQFDANLRRQDELAHHGIQYRAQDVMRAYKATGIHPLALLGVQGPTFTPSSSVFTQSPLGDAVGRAGQDVSRGIHATADRRLRGEALDIQRIGLKQAAERGALENELLRLQISSAQQRLVQGSGPSMPSPNVFPDVVSLIQGNPDAGQRHTDPGVAYRRFSSHPSGGLIPTMSKEYQESTEDSILDKAGFFVDQRILPMVGMGGSPPYPAKKGYRWSYRWNTGWTQLPLSTHGHVRPRRPWMSIPSNQP